MRTAGDKPCPHCGVRGTPASSAVWRGIRVEAVYCSAENVIAECKHIAPFPGARASGESRHFLLFQLFPSISQTSFQDLFALQRPISITGMAVLSLWSLQASRCRSGTRQKCGVHRAAPSAHPRGMQREQGAGVTSPAMVLLGWSRGLEEDTGTEQLPGLCSSTFALCIASLCACVSLPAKYTQ